MQKKKKRKRFSKNVFTDKYSSFISNPEYVAEHMTNTILDLGDFNTAVELCSCVGSTCIQLAKRFEKVIGIDINKKRIEMARKNARLYKANNIEFIKGDVLNPKLLKTIKADVAVLDPGWSTRVMDRSSHVSDIDSTKPSLRKMFNLTCKCITKNIVARIPATFKTHIIEKLGNCKIENIYIKDELVFKIAYFLINSDQTYQEDIFFK
ncbi:methyltransferase domain-containing protein [Candidatus Dojkabacteria bacterium]|nr:methyltransferase domain-containing protein [Candidatus Dojkabacteria bacterium]